MRKRALISYLPLLVFAFILTTCGGGGGGEGGGSSATINPSVTSTTPTDGTTGVAAGSVITATFNNQMDPSTINAGTFTVSRGGSNLTGTVTYDSSTRTVTFTPSGHFALATRYTATITTGVRDLAGSPMSVSYAWNFTSRDGIWGTAQLIETGNAGDARSPDIAMDASGSAIAVWSQYDGGRDNIWANQFN